MLNGPRSPHNDRKTRVPRIITSRPLFAQAVAFLSSERQATFTVRIPVRFG